MLGLCTKPGSLNGVPEIRSSPQRVFQMVALRVKEVADDLSTLILSVLLMIPLVCCASGENLLRIESWGSGAPGLSISVPSGYSVQKRKGADFDVHYIRLKNPNDPSMGIYIGHHPNPFSSQKKGIETRREADVILEQNVEWILWQEKEDGKTTYHCETIVNGVFKGMGGSGVSSLIVHVFIRGPDQKKGNLLKTSAKSLQIVRK